MQKPRRRDENRARPVKKDKVVERERKKCEKTGHVEKEEKKTRTASDDDISCPPLATIALFSIDSKPSSTRILELVLLLRG